MWTASTFTLRRRQLFPGKIKSGDLRLSIRALGDQAWNRSFFFVRHIAATKQINEQNKSILLNAGLWERKVTDFRRHTNVLACDREEQYFLVYEHACSPQRVDNVSMMFIWQVLKPKYSNNHYSPAIAHAAIVTMVLCMQYHNLIVYISCGFFYICVKSNR